MATKPDYVTDVADVTLATCEGGEVRCNLGDVGDGTGIGAEVILMCSEGFYGMPNNPSPAGACQVMYLRDGQQKTAFATWDGRFHEKAGAPKHGDRWIVSNCSARFMLRRAQSQIALFSENEVDDGSTMMVEVNGSTGEMQLVNGGTFIRLLKDNITMTADGATLEISADGVSICGKHFAANTGGGNLGTVGAAPPPQGAMSITAGATGMAAVGSSKWTVSLLIVLWFMRALWTLARSA